MKKTNFNKIAMDIIFVSIGCLLVAFAITSILKPNGLIFGGITGTSIILDKILHIKYTYINYALSILVLIIAWLTLGKKEAFKIMTLSLVFPFVLIVFERLNFSFIKGDMMLASVYFGITCGLGGGLILKRGFSQGGSDTIAKILHNKFFPFISLSELLLAIDGAVILTSAIIYNKDVALYAIISQIILIKTIDMVLFGFNSKKVKLEILSDKHEEISVYILHTINRGVTSYDVKGGYLNLTRTKLITICSPRESMLIKRFIASVDKDAFVSVEPINSVWGNGVGFESIVDEE